MTDTTTTASRTEALIQQEHDVLVQWYKRPDVVFVHGEGVHLYDSEGNAYLDFVAGIAVNALGYGDADVAQAVAKQMATGLLHTSNLYHTAPHIELAQALVDKSFADRVYFCNSGTEANEAAIKFARKVAFDKGQTDKTEIITFEGAFHGRTMGALALTPKDKYQMPFKPLMPGAVVAEFNNLDSVKAVISDKTAAVFVEPIQGEGGINIATPEFLQGLRQLCDEHTALLVFDEIQCGLGRTGKLWAHEHSGVTPDIMTLAKPLAAGLPIGAVLCTEMVGTAIHPGDHGSTFAGGPVVTAVGQVVVDKISRPEFLAHVQRMGEYLMERLSEINSPLIKAIRGQGLMVAIELTTEVAPFIARGYAHGLLLLNAGTHVLRLLPPLTISEPHVDSLVEKLTLMLEQAQ